MDLHSRRKWTARPDPPPLGHYSIDIFDDILTNRIITTCSPFATDVKFNFTILEILEITRIDQLTETCDTLIFEGTRLCSSVVFHWIYSEISREKMRESEKKLVEKWGNNVEEIHMEIGSYCAGTRKHATSRRWNIFFHLRQETRRSWNHRLYRNKLSIRKFPTARRNFSKGDRHRHDGEDPLPD